MRVIAYTAVFGGYDTLKPAGHRCVCLTDNPQGTEGWEFNKIILALKPVFANRFCKMFPWIFFPEAEYSVYFDGNLELLSSPEQIVERNLVNCDLALFPHPRRNCIYEEGEACVRHHKASRGEVDEHLARLRELGYPEQNGLATCWVLVRRHSEMVKQLSEEWWREFVAGAHRDQLSFNYVTWKLGVEYEEIPGNLFEMATSDFSTRKKHEKNNLNSSL